MPWVVTIVCFSVENHELKKLITWSSWLHCRYMYIENLSKPKSGKQLKHMIFRIKQQRVLGKTQNKDNTIPSGWETN